MLQTSKTISQLVVEIQPSVVGLKSEKRITKRFRLFAVYYLLIAVYYSLFIRLQFNFKNYYYILLNEHDFIYCHSRL